MKFLLQFPLAFVLVSLLFISACASGSKLVKQSKVYYYQKQQGSVQVDPNGNEIHLTPDTIIVVYVEASSKLLEWDSVWFNHKAYTVKSILLNTAFVEVGIEKMSKEKAAVIASQGHYLYELYLEPISGFMPALHNGAVDTYPILKGRYKGKAFQKTGFKPVEIESIPAV